MKGIYWRTLTFKKSVIYLIKVNYTLYNYTPCKSTWTCLMCDFSSKVVILPQNQLCMNEGFCLAQQLVLVEIQWINQAMEIGLG